MYVRIKAAVARSEVERMGKRRSRALLQHAKKGGVPTGPRLYGYNFDGSVNEYEAEIFRTIYKRFLEKVAIKTMCRTLSGKPVDGNPVPGLPCTPRPSYALAVERNERRKAENKPVKDLPAEQPWTNTTVTSMLRNPRYAGFSFKMTDEERAAEGNNSQTSSLKLFRAARNGTSSAMRMPNVTHSLISLCNHAKDVAMRSREPHKAVPGFFRAGDLLFLNSQSIKPPKPYDRFAARPVIWTSRRKAGP